MSTLVWIIVFCLIGGVIAYASLEDAERVLPYVLAVAAASLIYIADLIPTLPGPRSRR